MPVAVFDNILLTCILNIKIRINVIIISDATTPMPPMKPPKKYDRGICKSIERIAICVCNFTHPTPLITCICKALNE